MSALPTVRFGDFDDFGNLDLFANKGRNGRSPPSTAFRRIPPVHRAVTGRGLRINSLLFQRIAI
jgi:hypothetical protein